MFTYTYTVYLHIRTYMYIIWLLNVYTNECIWLIIDHFDWLIGNHQISRSHTYLLSRVVVGMVAASDIVYHQVDTKRPFTVTVTTTNITSFFTRWSQPKPVFATVTGSGSMLRYIRLKPKTCLHTLLETIAYPFPKVLLKMIFLFPRWDMLVSWRVSMGIHFWLLVGNFQDSGSMETTRPLHYSSMWKASMEWYPTRRHFCCCFPRCGAWSQQRSCFLQSKNYWASHRPFRSWYIGRFLGNCHRIPSNYWHVEWIILICQNMKELTSSILAKFLIFPQPQKHRRKGSLFAQNFWLVKSHDATWADAIKGWWSPTSKNDQISWLLTWGSLPNILEFHWLVKCFTLLVSRFTKWGW